MVLNVTTLLDGKGNVLRNTGVVVQDGKIARIDPKAAPITHGFGSLTVLPGWIDTHVHIDWHFGPNGKYGDKVESPEQAALAYASNAWKTLSAGFTTVQALGSVHDKDLRDAINRGELPGPRILTSLNPSPTPSSPPTRFASPCASTNRRAQTSSRFLHLPVFAPPASRQ